MTTRATKYEIRTAAVKDAVRHVAADLFARQGFAATGVREIASRAGTDPALVIRHFGSKEGLFLETMRMPNLWIDLMSGSLEGLGQRVVRFVAESAKDETSRGVYAALIRASDRPEVRRQLQAMSSAVFIDPLLPKLSGDGAMLRARLFAAGVGGLMSALWVTEDPVVTSAAPDDLAALVGPSLQRYLF